MHSTFEVLVNMLNDIDNTHKKYLNDNQTQTHMQDQTQQHLQEQTQPHLQDQTQEQTQTHPQDQTQTKAFNFVSLIPLSYQINYIDKVGDTMTLNDLDILKIELLDKHNVNFKIFKKLKQNLLSVVMCVDNSQVIFRLLAKDILNPLEKAYLIIRSVRYLGNISDLLCYFCGEFDNTVKLVLIKYMIHVYNLIYIDKIIEFFSTFDNFIIFCRNVCNNKRLMRRSLDVNTIGYQDRKIKKFLHIPEMELDYDDMINKILADNTDDKNSARGFELIKYNSITNKVIQILMLKIGDYRIIDHIITNEIYYYDIVIYENFRFLMFENIKFSLEMTEEIKKFKNQHLIKTTEILLKEYNKYSQDR